MEDERQPTPDLHMDRPKLKEYLESTDVTVNEKLYVLADGSGAYQSGNGSAFAHFHFATAIEAPNLLVSSLCNSENGTANPTSDPAASDSQADDLDQFVNAPLPDPPMVGNPTVVLEGVGRRFDDVLENAPQSARKRDRQGEPSTGEPRNPKRMRAVGSCYHCRKNKEKCDEYKPCASCRKRSLDCYREQLDNVVLYRSTILPPPDIKRSNSIKTLKMPLDYNKPSCDVSLGLMLATREVAPPTLQLRCKSYVSKHQGEVAQTVSKLLIAMPESQSEPIACFDNDFSERTKTFVRDCAIHIEKDLREMHARDQLVLFIINNANWFVQHAPRAVGPIARASATLQNSVADALEIWRLTHFRRWGLVKKDGALRRQNIVLDCVPDVINYQIDQVAVGMMDAISPSVIKRISCILFESRTVALENWPEAFFATAVLLCCLTDQITLCLEQIHEAVPPDYEWRISGEMTAELESSAYILIDHIRLAYGGRHLFAPPRNASNSHREMLENVQAVLPLLPEWLNQRESDTKNPQYYHYKWLVDLFRCVIPAA